MIRCPRINQSFGSRNRLFGGAHDCIHFFKFSSVPRADLPQEQNLIIASQRVTPSFKLPLDTPSVPCAIMRMPDTCVTNNFVPNFISAVLNLTTSSNSFSLVELPLYRECSCTSFSVVSITVSLFNFPSLPAYSTAHTRFSNSLQLEELESSVLFHAPII